MAHGILNTLEQVDGLAETSNGTRQRLDFRCRRCGYGIVVTQPPADGCPMCHTTSWVATGTRTMLDAQPTLPRRRLLASERIKSHRA